MHPERVETQLLTDPPIKKEPVAAKPVNETNVSPARPKKVSEPIV